MRPLYDIATRAQVLCIKISGAINADIKAPMGNEYRKGLLDVPRRAGPLEHYVPQNDWDDMSDKDKENLQLEVKVKAKPRKRALKKAVKSAARAALAAVFAIQEA